MKKTNEWINWNAQEQNTQNYKAKLKEKRMGSKIFLCPNCSSVFESAHVDGESNRVHIYEDFPTYKLKRLKCPNCAQSK
jgi:uncharacterized C2H2 Zn-finger protein